jgi:hypothetical protein
MGARYFATCEYGTRVYVDGGVAVSLARLPDVAGSQLTWVTNAASADL